MPIRRRLRPSVEFTSLTTHLARKSFSVSIMLANGVNIGVLSKTLGHSSIQVTLDSYADIINELVIKDINMVRKKLKSRK